MLDDFSLDDSFFPISPASSVLDTLAAFHGPSPSITPSTLEFTWSSSEIPIILYDNAYTDDSVSGLFISGNSKRDSVGSDASSRFSQRLPTASLTERHRESVVISNSASSDTIRSAATFGTRKQSPSPEAWHTSSYRYLQSVGEQPPGQSSEPTMVEDCGTVMDDTCFSRRALSCVSNHLDSLATHNKQRLNIGKRYSVHSIERASIPSEGTYMGLLSSATPAPVFVENSADGPGGLKRSPSVQTWVSSSEWSYNSLELTSGPPNRTSLAFDEEGLSESEATSQSPEIVQEHHEALSPFEPPYEPALHGLDVFLRATTVQFVIDQEGFRDAEPSFKFCGISRLRSSGENRPPNNLMAQFRPISREQFHFHHAPFETPPVLRRITVNNDDTSDYVSRQAHLTLKSNGVYVIHGHEVLSAEHVPQHTKLYWQFEYLVDDRRVESWGSRRDLEGEKTFTPLTFSCSPRLLLPSQAKRINIMHVFKKSLAPKLVAEKLQVRLGNNRINNNRSPEKTLPPEVPYYGDRRSPDPRSRVLRDDAPNRRAISDHIRSQSEWQNAAGPDTTSSVTALSRFSAPCSSPVDERDSNTTGSIDISHRLPPPTVDRHIVPPTRLSELLIQNSSVSKEGHALGHHVVTPDSSGGRSLVDSRERDSKAFLALSPRPKRPTSLKVR